MSPLAVLGSAGFVMSTVVMLPHLVHAIRARRPSGAPLAWFAGALAGGVWMVYGIAVGDLLVAAPNVVGVPANLFLGVWCVRTTRDENAAREVVHLEAVLAA